MTVKPDRPTRRASDPRQDDNGDYTSGNAAGHRRPLAHLALSGINLANIARQGGLVLAWVVLCGVFTGTYPAFLSGANFVNIFLGASILAIVALGQTMVVMTAGIDLSVGSILALSGVTTALCLEHGLPAWLAVIIGIASGTIAGIVNGLIIVSTSVTPFMVTLGTMSIFSGVALVISGGRPIYNLSSGFVNPLTATVAGLPMPVWIMIAAGIVFGLVMRYTNLGELTLAIGGNEEAVRLSGVSVNRTKIAIYAAAGFAASIGGVLTAARLASADPTAGTDVLLTSIAAAVMGGASLLGGEGSMFGAIVGAIVITTLQTGLTLDGVSTFYQNIAVGAVIIVVVAADQLTKRQNGAGNSLARLLKPSTPHKRPAGA